MNRRLSPTSHRPPPPRASRGALPLALAGVLCLPALGWVGPIQTPDSLLDLYDLTSDAGVQAKLPRVLEEVSGLATTPDGRLFSHNDERAIIYQIAPGSGELVKAFSVGTLGIPGDFEGIAVAGERFFLLSSTGEIVEFREGAAGSSVGYRIHSLGLGNRCEFEGLAFDEAEGALLLPCKTPRTRALAGHLVVFSVPLSTMRPDSIPRIFLPLEELAAGGLSSEFHPSAIEVHPGTRSIILLAAREEALLELSPGGEIVFTQKLKRKDHPQAEGVAFLPDGTLVLADEGQGKRGTLTLYSRRAPEGGRER